MSKRTRASIAAISIAIVGIAAASRDARPADAHPLKIGIIGAGKIGGTLATLWVKAGHEVLVSARPPHQPPGPARSPGPQAPPRPPPEAAPFGDLDPIPVPYGAPPPNGKEFQKERK